MENVPRSQQASLLQQLLVDVAGRQTSSASLFRFPGDDAGTEQVLSARELAAQAGAVSRALQERLAPQSRVFIVMSYGVDFAASLLGCLAANVIAVPFALSAPEPSPQEIARLRAMRAGLGGFDRTVILADKGTQAHLQEAGLCEGIACLSPAELGGNPSADWLREAGENDIALVLFTSGSTGDAKGIPLTHVNILHQIEAGARQWSMTAGSHVVSWLSASHNFGLHFGLLAPFASGAQSTFIRPGDYMKRPALWFETVHRLGATHIGAPNFAFDFCAEAIAIEALPADALQSVEHIICGGEPVRQQTVARFFEKFGRVGGRRETFRAHYGLSECGALATRHDVERSPFAAMDAAAFRARKLKNAEAGEAAVNVANCGPLHESAVVCIVSPDTGHPCNEDEIGEVWVKSPSVASGYLGAPGTAQPFGCTIAATGESGFFRTGDLGFVRQGGLHIAGREKEVIIVRGKNHFPADIEATISAAVKAELKPVVFGIEKAETEAVVALLETGVDLSAGECARIAADIRRKVAALHGLALAGLAFAGKGKVFPAGAGKLKRRPIKEAYLTGQIPLLWQEGDETASPAGETSLQGNAVDLLRERVFAKVLGTRALQFRDDSVFSEAGLDSLQCTRLAGEIESVFGIPFEPTQLFKFQTLREIAAYLESRRTHLASSFSSSSTMPVNAARAASQQGAASRFDEEPVAIVAMHCEFPGAAAGTQDYWDLLNQGGDAIDLIERQRPELWNAMRAYPGLQESALPRWAGLLNDVDKFDAAFFGISRREAECMDPQQRKMLEFVWKLAEHAGHDPLSWSGQRIGLFVGVHCGDYGEILAGRPDLMAQCGAYIDSGSHLAMIPNRASRWFNLNGPSEVVNTACSSSLVAVHRAVESLRSGECTQAVVAGINLILTPRVLLSSADAGMLSPEGRCKTLDAAADGFVRAEGVAGVLLKPLSAALADGDTIHGLIRGVAVNHDGRSNSLRAPNVNAQRELLVSAYTQSATDPASVRYIELHGTGTRLGDPIEIQALKEAFETLNPSLPAGQCGLGSVKSNIGHAESAAGMAGLIKVLLAFRHRTLPRTNHLKSINPLIQLDESPFRAVAQNESWDALTTPDGAVLPRRAGISSFGFGGVNAHAVLEEHVASQETAVDPVPNAASAFLLSARTATQLRDQASQLHGWLAGADRQTLRLADIAFTLQVGRAALEHRLGILAHSIDELLEKLDAVAKQDERVSGVFQGNAKGPDAALSDLDTEGELTQMIHAWAASGRLNKVVSLWARGVPVDWAALYGAARPRRIALPTYPFARERYWVPEATPALIAAVGTSLHPLVHRNTSNLSEQRFSTKLSGEEFFLKDHVVQGRKVLPAAAQLEMARAAVAQALELDEEQGSRIELRNVVFASPVVVDSEGLELHIGLTAEDDGAVGYEIYSGREEKAVVHGQGRATVAQAQQAPMLDLPVLQAACTRHTDAQQCYDAFAQRGLVYGPGFQGLQHVHAGQDAEGAFALAAISLPQTVAGTQGSYVLHPSLVDAALQAGIGLVDDASTAPLTLPFAVGQIRLLSSSMPSRGWVLVRQSEDSSAAVQKLDVTVADEQGKVCVALNGFSSRVFKSVAEANEVKTVLMQPQWVEQELPAGTASYGNHSIVLCEVPSLETGLASTLPQAQVLRLHSEHTTLAERYTDYAAQLLAHVQQLIASKPQGEVLIQLVMPAEGEASVLRGLGALLKSAGQENPKLLGQVLALPMQSEQAMAERIAANATAGVGEIRYESDARQQWQLQPITAGETAQPWKDGGVYLITGGAGGLGLIFAQAIATQAKGATLVLTGRSVLSESKEATLDVLRSLGAHVDYRRADIGDAEAVRELIEHIRQRHGKLDGVLHSAGVLRDSFLIKKTEEELREVFAPKVAGLLHLDAATQDLELDHFVVFGSSAGVLGNVGQADYAAANAFMDAYATYRNTLVVQGQRKGKTLSVDWPLWAEGGMQIDAAARERLWRSLGQAPMESEAGVLALKQALSLDSAQVAVFAGDSRKILDAAKTLQGHGDEEKQAAITPPTVADSAALESKLRLALVRISAGLLKTDGKDLDPETELSEFGFDSITLTAFGNELNSKYGLELTPTIFFEYPTIVGLATYLAREHGAVLGKHFIGTTQAVQVQQPAQAVHDASGTTATELTPSNRRRSRFNPASVALHATRAPSVSPATEPIAIIGMSGCFPEAADIDALWQNLLAGRDCIGDIPATRWNWDVLYGDPHKEANKTNIKRAGLIDGVDRFDPLFFGISPREAEVMDPQQRLLMMHVWKVIEDAGYSAHSLSGSNTGLFIGTGASGYNTLLSMAGETIEGYSAPGMVPSVGPNRMSYLLNLHGPSEPIETACSSALVAVHRALLSMQAGQCEMAIVGGVNTLISPEPHISFSKAGMLSPDGQCKTFSAQANGYVRGEGVGMLMLKKLSAAERDGDTIHAVIRGSAENHGGRANSLTAPNPRAQADLIKAALKQAGIAPGSIGYIEAHGTGTPLGDPIEVQGLHLAFRELAQESGHTLGTAQCGIGSIKTNIGHLELAAGVAGLIKAVLQMRHKTLVKSLHSDEINPYIQLQDSPFYVVQENRPWEAPKDQQGRTQPRRAGVSSFGFGGVNAHVVLEEYVEKKSRERKAVTPQQPAVIVLSAKTEERLQAQAKQLLQALERHADADLADIAYTLQVGREGMEARLACIVPDLAALKEKLGLYLQGKDGIEELYTGEARRGSDGLASLATDEDIPHLVDAWLAKGKFSKLAELWCKGLAFDWNRLYREDRPQRISLPTYPFAEERYWAPQQVHSKGTQEAATTAVTLHPLVQRNTSDFTQQRFTSTLTGEEFFLKDHIVQGQRVLPGVAYLEMARAAVMQAVGEAVGEASGIRIENVAWVRPLVVGANPVELHIGLTLEESGAIAFEAYTEQEQEERVYARGRAVLLANDSPQLDLASLKAQCRKTLAGPDCYKLFDSVGLTLGSAFRALQQLHGGVDAAGHAIAFGELRLHDSVMDSRHRYALHPGLIDSSLQTSIGLAMDDLLSRGLDRLNVPFALESAEIFAPVPADAVAIVRHGPDSQPETGVQKLDIDIADTAGLVCVRLHHFTARVLDGIPGTAKAETLLLRPEWRSEVETSPAAMEYATRYILLCEVPEAEHVIAAEVPQAQCRRLRSPADTISERYADHAAQLLQCVQEATAATSRGEVLIQLAVPGQGERSALRGLAGLLKCANQENARIHWQVLEVEESVSADALAAQLRAEAGSAAQHVRHLQGRREVLAFSEVQAPAAVQPAWKDGGVYLVTGGAGGLGLLFAETIARQAKDVVLVLTGRSALGPEKFARLKTLESHGAVVEYRAVDVSEPVAVRELVELIAAEHGSLDGVFHCAGVLRDSLLQKKTALELREVFAPKVDGVFNLDQATAGLPLDFFIVFSSAAAVTGNIGQADYAAANAFMDAWLAHRNELVSQGRRHGRTLSVNWPLWAEGGMQIDEASRERMWRSTGMAPLETAAGLQALADALQLDVPQLAVFSGHAGRIRQRLQTLSSRPAARQPSAPAPAPVVAAASIPVGTPASGAPGADEMREKVESALLRMASDMLNISRDSMQAATELSKYGFDSIMFTAFGNALNQKYGLELSPTVFFEYPTIRKLVAHLLDEQGAVLAKHFGTASVPARPTAAPVAAAPHVPVPVPLPEGMPRRGRSRFAAPVAAGSAARQDAAAPEPVAIVGISGCFPEARDIDAFWENLKAGRDCITEIPDSRWNWEELYGDPHKEANKTNVKRAGVIEGVEEFDPLFFGISPREAEAMDPQQRLLMTYIWKVIEDAGYDPYSLSDSTMGLLIGTMNSGYYHTQLVKAGETIEGYSAPGMLPSVGPNRMSYLLNLHGPSEPIETACSTSLVAIHRAVLMINAGQCDMAIAGGVNILIAPEVQVSFTKAGMLCEDGRCKTFSAQANGYVRGEGVGMVMLKKLSAAERDGDHIYAVIRGSAENHGGRASSLTAPNPRAQTDVIKAAFRQAGIDPTTVGYIEAHGTGTPLGDPIEIQGLKSAFKELNEGREALPANYCGVGSVKTNIGHLELSAGVAGLIKVLLQMKHKTLVKSLHSEEINPYIQLENSPFYILQEARPWEAVRDALGRELPRRAGVSSFGFGGVNAHVLLEEYVPQQQSFHGDVGPDNPVAIVLSAKNEERLKEQAAQLLAALGDYTDSDLTDIAYTLQVGREAMEARLACTAASIDELKEKLGQYLQGRNGIDGLYRSEVRRGKDALAAAAVDDDMGRMIEAWLEKGKVSRLLDLWVKGLSFDWSRLYGQSRPRRLSLPTYPFARERYWARELKQTAHAPEGLGTAVLHPLVQRNTSDFSEQRFSSTFTGSEIFLKDHIVQGQRVLPGVAYLEMARAAVMLAAGADFGASTGIRLENVVWVRPLIVGDEPVELHIRLELEESDAIAFEAYTSDGGELEHVYARGRAVLFDAGNVADIDLERLKSGCTQTVEGEACYKAFDSVGLTLGPAFRAVRHLHAGADETGQALALGQLHLHENAKATRGRYVLHPGLIDSSLQTILGLSLADWTANGLTKLNVPFALDSATILGPVPDEAFSVVRKGAGSAQDGTIQKFDIDITDASGKVCVQLRGFAGRVLEDVTGEAPADLLILQSEWIDTNAPVADTAIRHARHVVVLCGVGQAEDIAAELPQAQLVRLDGEEDSLAERYTVYAARLLQHLQQILQARPQEAVLVQLVVPVSGEESILRGLGALLRSAAQENPKLAAQVLMVPERIQAADLAGLIKANAATDATEVRYLADRRQQLEWREAQAESEGTAPWKDEGVYLITGGAGGLGLVFAKEIAGRVRNPVLVLTGRSALDEDRQTALDVLRSLGARVEYHAADVGDPAAVQALVGDIVSRHGHLSGVLHGAGVLKDGFIVGKDVRELEAVFAPKVAGLLNLDQATRDIKLDCFLLFSSIAATLGNVGQSDYAAANAFMDAWAGWRTGLVEQGQRHGRTLSVNWPLWAEGGMQIDAASRERMWRSTGMAPLETMAGLRALRLALALGGAQAAVFYGHAKRIRQRLLARQPKQQAESAVQDVSQQQGDAGAMREKVEAALVGIVSELLNISRENISVNAELSTFGFDSIMFTGFNNVLNRKYGLELSPTVFFEYPTLEDLSAYLVREHQSLLAGHFSVAKRAVSAIAQQAAVPVPHAAVESPRKRRMRFGSVDHAAVVAPDAGQEPIAIIGISGRFPQARDIDAFWENLKAGRDCIGEIPDSRWNWEELYGDPQKEANKTNIKRAGLIEGVEEFDPLFFGISPREAEAMDPQQRLLMMHVWKVIEDAGYSTQSLSGSNAGLFVGTGASGYSALLTRSGEAIEGFTAPGMVPSVGPNRMSYLLNLHGPSEPIETACSSALVAVHRAVSTIRAGQCEAAIAGGINILIAPELQVSFTKAGMLCEDGRCKTFSAQANGYVRGEGVGMVMLKRLSAAERDGDHIYAVIRGSAENHGGRASSLTAPNPRAQTDVIKTAFRQAGIDPATVGYIEAHGTGTPLGDPIEIQGLKSAFKELSEGRGTLPANYCGVGSVKTNIGHLELSAGVAGLIKVLLQMKHKTLVKSLHSEEINPYIQLENSPFYILQEARPWEAVRDAQGLELPRRAGVSSFSFGGVNAHVVLEEYIPAQEPRIAVNTDQPAVVVLSAKNEERLREQVQQLRLALDSHDQEDLADIAYTLQVGRDAMEARLACVVAGIEELKDKLDRYLRGDSDIDELYRGDVKRNKDALALFAADDELQEAVAKWMQRGKFSKLANLWTKGLAFDWSVLYGDKRPRRISLPTYPFARERYWATLPASPANVPATVRTASYVADVPDLDSTFLSRLLADLENNSLDIESALAKAQEAFFEDDARDATE